MSRRRRWLVYVLAATIVTGHLYDVALEQEHWPFSSYPMYSHLNRELVLVLPRVVGVRGDGSEVLLWRSEHLAPFDQARLIQALETTRQQPNGLTPLATALGDCLARYERRRAAALHDGPTLDAIRLYHTRWTLEPDAANVDRPDRLDLVMEVAAKGPG